jgi:hypothetical protein
MRLPRSLRLTVRRLMMLVAVVGLAVGIEMGRRRACAYRERARFHLEEASFYREHARLWDRRQNGGCMEVSDTTPVGFDAAATRARREGDDHERLAHDYERAACYPWLSVFPYPPEPR